MTAAAASRGRLLRNTGTAFGGQVGRVLLQAAYFVVLARTLGVTGFGAFAGTVALVSLVAPFGSLGSLNLMIANIVRDPASAARQFATALAVTAGSGVLLAAAVAAAGHWVAPAAVAWWMLLCIAGGELLGTRLLDVAGAVHQARDRMGPTAAFPLVLYGVRLLAAVGLSAAVASPDLGVWSVLYLVGSLAVTGPVLVLTRRHLGGGLPDWGRYRSQWREGLLFAVSFASQSVYNDIDKTMLARLGTLEATGIYSAAYRLVDMAMVPMKALLAANYTRFFREGAHGLPGAVGHSRRLATPGLGYCLVASAALVAGADLVPIVLGEAYEPAVAALRGLALLPLLKGVHYLAADALTGAGQQGARSVVQIGVAVLNLGLNAWLIPLFSWRGAVAASLVCDLVLGACLWSLVAVRLRRGTRRTAVAAAASSAPAPARVLAGQPS